MPKAAVAKGPAAEGRRCEGSAAKGRLLRRVRPEAACRVGCDAPLHLNFGTEIMKADVLKFVACYFGGTLEICFSQNPGTKVMHGRYLPGFSNNPNFSGQIYFWGQK